MNDLYYILTFCNLLNISVMFFFLTANVVNDVLVSLNKINRNIVKIVQRRFQPILS